MAWSDADDESDDADWSQLAGWQVPDPALPDLVSMPVGDVRENLSGLRARVRLTSFDGARLVAMGWRHGLRVLSARPESRADVGEGAVLVAEEADWYRCLSDGQQPPASWVGGSRVEVDVWRPVGANAGGRSRLVPATRVPCLIGRRVLVLRDDGSAATDFRAVSETRMSSHGDLVASVAAERDWYEWSSHDYGKRHPSLQVVRAGRLWVEI